jgi:hypothetical protein
MVVAYSKALSQYLSVENNWNNHEKWVMRANVRGLMNTKHIAGGS